MIRKTLESGFYDGLSCTGFGVPELSMCDFLYGMREMEFGTMQNPPEILERIARQVLP